MRSNLVKSRMLLVLAAGALLWSFQSAVADTIIPIDQARSVTILLSVPCGGGTFYDQDAAEGFEPFDSMIEMLIDCDSGLGFAAASQQSQIDPNSITASGTSASEALAPVQTLIHAIGDSNFNVTFELESESQFTMAGLLSAESLDDPIAELFAARLSLLDANYQAIFHWIVEPGPDGAPNSQVIEEFGLLEPGVYTIRAEAISLIDNYRPPNRSGEASFNFEFEVHAT